MTDPDSRHTSSRPANGKPATPAKPARKRKPASGAPASGKRPRLGGNLSLRQSRVFAMQALFEDDLTGHGLDDILQHFGEHKRRDLVDYFAHLRAAARKTVETIGFLARNADRDASGPGLTLFQESTDKAFRALDQDLELPDGDLADEYLALWQDRAGQEVRRLLDDFRRTAGDYLKQVSVDAPPAPAKSFLELAVEDEDDVDDEDFPLADLQARTTRQLTGTLARQEKESIAALMEILQRTGRLARGVQERQADIDPHIEQAAPAFPIPQLASIDRAVLRIAVYELQFEPDVPFKAAVNEAVDIAKRYGGPSSGRFVNGVLRTIAERIRPGGSPPSGPPAAS
jgi:transcription antitermination factor NusB